MLFLINFLFLIFISFAFYSFSKIILKKFSADNLLEDYLFHSACGIIIISAIIIIAGFTNFLYKELIYTIVSIQIIAALFNTQNIENLVKYLFTKFQYFYFKTKILTLLLLLNIILHLPGALAPVVSLDGLTYHLTLPKLYLQAHKIYSVNFLFYSFFPQFSETLFLYGLSLASPEFAQIFHYFFYVLTLLLICLFSQKIIKNIFFAILTALAFASTPAINRLAGYIKTEFILIFFICFSLYYLFLFFQTSEKKHLFYSAIFSAIANNVKYHGLIHSLIFIAILMFLFASKKIKIKTAVCAVFLLLLLSSPFYIKNYLDIGNPFYPFLCKYFNIKNIVSDEKNETQYIQEKSASMVRHFSEKKITGSPVISAIKFPYIVSIKFQTYDFWKYALSPLFFVFLCYIIIAVILKKETYCFYIFTFYIFAFIYLIYFNAPRARYVLPIYPIICVFGIYAFNSFMAQYPKLFRANIIIFFFIILINYPLLAAQHFTRYKVLFGFETKNEYLAKRMYSDGEFYQAIQWCNANLKNTDLLFVTHQLSFYFDIPVILGYTPNLTLSPINNINVYNELDFLEKLKKNNVSHIFYSHKFAVRFSYDIVEHIEKLQRQNYLIPLKEFNNNTIYLINYK